jgi:hypothetical protein
MNGNNPGQSKILAVRIGLAILWPQTKNFKGR